MKGVFRRARAVLSWLGIVDPVTEVYAPLPHPTALFGYDGMTEEARSAVITVVKEAFPDVKVEPVRCKDGTIRLAFEGRGIAEMDEILTAAKASFKERGKELEALDRAGKTAEADEWIAQRAAGWNKHAQKRTPPR